MTGDRKAELSAENISVSFAGLRALSNVTFAVHTGEIVGLIGPNGAGKTTMVNVLTGFQRPTDGRVLLNGTDITRYKADAVAKSGVARSFQAARMFNALSVAENVEVAALGHGAPRRQARARASEILEWIDFGGKAESPASELSYGDQRRLGIARALAGAPKFLLLDEPASGMNDAECDDLNAHIAEIPSRFNCGVLLIEHNMRVIMQACGRIHVLEGGRSLAEGTPDDVRTNPAVRAAYLGADQHPPKAT